MGHQLPKKVYQRLIENNVEEVEKLMGDTLESNHIIAILKDSVNYYYPETIEAEYFLKFNPDGETFNVGESVYPVSSKKNQIIMEKRPIDPDGLNIYVVTDDKPDKDGCIIAMVIKQKKDQFCKCGRLL